MENEYHQGCGQGCNRDVSPQARSLPPIALKQSERETEMRLWIAARETVCPYAPGVARYVHLPKIKQGDASSLRYMANELRAFYREKVNGKRVERLILIPEIEWESHDVARLAATETYYLLGAAYYQLARQGSKSKAAQQGKIAGVIADPACGILNPIVGKLPVSASVMPHPKALFCTAMSPHYRSKKYFRYAPVGALVLVYVSDVYGSRQGHLGMLKKISEASTYGTLCEIYGDDLCASKEQVARELPIWESLIEQTLRFAKSNQLSAERELATKPCPLNAQNMCLFDETMFALADSMCRANLKFLPVLRKLTEANGMSSAEFLRSIYDTAGLYAWPRYL